MASLASYLSSSPLLSFVLCSHDERNLHDVLQGDEREGEAANATERAQGPT